MNELPAPTARGGRRHNNAQKTRQSVSCPWYLFSFRSTLYDAGNSRSYAKPILLFPCVPRPSEERRKDGKIRHRITRNQERGKERKEGGKKKKKPNCPTITPPSHRTCTGPCCIKTLSDSNPGPCAAISLPQLPTNEPTCQEKRREKNRPSRHPATPSPFQTSQTLSS